jgi:hypothetical protein
LTETQVVDDPHPGTQGEGHDSHGQPEDPNAAPMRLDVRESFPVSAVLFCVVLGAIAIVAGTLVGLTVN